MTTYAPTRPAFRRPTARRAPARPTAPRVPMDARIRDRRVAVVREQGRRRLHRLLAAVGILAVATVAAGVVLSPLLDVDRVDVSGAPGAEAVVRKAAAVDTGAPLLLLDTAEVEARIEALPWVADARVTRELPDALAVHVTPRVPVGWMPASDGKFLVVGSRGIVLARIGAQPPGLPRLGSEAADPKARTVLPAAARVAGGLTPALRARALAIVVSGDEAAVALADGPQLRLGAPRGVAAKARAAEAILGALGAAPATYIDVRVPSAPVTG